MTQHITQEQIRAAGGIVHRDGNIFFTNIDQLNAALAQQASAPAAVSGWPCEIISGDFAENTLTIEMKCDDYRISAGRFYLTAAPTGEPG